MSWSSSSVFNRGSTSSMQRRRSAIGSQPPANHKFDRDSGLEYTETYVAMQTGSDHDWVYRSDLAMESESNNTTCQKRRPNTSNEDNSSSHSENKPRTGSRSLQDTVFDYLLQNITKMSSDSLAFLPVHLVEKLWHALSKSRQISLHTFCIFSKLLSTSATTLELLRYRYQISCPMSPLHTYIAPVTSKSFDFLTILSITHTFDVVDLVKLSGITNLMTLEIVAPAPQPGSVVSDRIVREWSMAAEDNGAFPLLRILRLWYHAEITSKSLSYIDAFPVLAIYDVCGCRMDLNRQDRTQWSNWTSHMSMNLLDHLETHCVRRRGTVQDKLSRQDILTRRREAKPLFDDENVTWMSQGGVPGYSNRSETLQTPESKTQSTKITARPVEPWDFVLYTSCSRIGELRNDRDLRFKISIGNRALVANELVNSCPVVSLRLGTTPLCLKIPYGYERTYPSYSYQGGYSPQNLVFIRIGLPKTLQTDPSFSKTHLMTSKDDQHHQGSGTLAASTAPPGGSASNLQTAVAKRSKAGTPKNKRRKLDDVLKSFF